MRQELGTQDSPRKGHRWAWAYRYSCQHGVTGLVCFLLMAQLIGATELMLLLRAAVLEVHLRVDRRLAQHQEPRVAKVCAVEPALHIVQKILTCTPKPGRAFIIMTGAQVILCTPMLQLLSKNLNALVRMVAMGRASFSQYCKRNLSWRHFGLPVEQSLAKADEPENVSIASLRVSAHSNTLMMAATQGPNRSDSLSHTGGNEAMIVVPVLLLWMTGQH